MWSARWQWRRGTSSASRLFMLAVIVGLQTPQTVLRCEPLQAKSTPRRVYPRPPIVAPPGYAPRTVASLEIPLIATDGVYYVQVTWDEYARDRLPTEIRFTLQTKNDRKIVFRYETGDHVKNILAPEGDSVVVTVSETGSAIMVRAFRLDADKVTLVLEQGTKFLPEFVSGGILLHAGWVPIGDRCCTAEKTEIWTWTGKKYKLASTVPYGKGYEALAKLPPSAWK